MKNEEFKTIVLNEPLCSRRMFGTTVHEIIKLRSPKVRDYLGLDFSGTKAMGSSVVLASRLSGISTDDILEMNGQDWIKVSAAIAELMNPPAKKAEDEQSKP